MPAPVLVILNPASSGGKAAGIRAVVEETLTAMDVAFELRATRGPGHAEALAREAVSEREVVVAVGGDGTVHEIAQGLLDARAWESGFADGRSDADDTAAVGSARDGAPALAVVPVGTGNDFFRMVGADRDPAAALEVLRNGRRTAFDVGTATWSGGRKHFVNLLGLGVDVDVLRRRRSFARLPGLAQYLAALLVAVLRFRPEPVRIRLDGEEPIEQRSHLAAVTVGPSAGGGFLLNPGATPEDGMLDLCFVEALSYPEIARYIPKVIRGTHGDLDVVILERFRKGVIDRPDGGAFHFQLDGELMPEAVTRLEVEVQPGALPVLVPVSAPGEAGGAGVPPASRPALERP